MNALPAGLTAGTYTIDTSHSEANFVVRHVGIAKVRGTVAGLNGTVVVGEDLASSNVNVELDPATVNTRDEKRDEHLRSGDFFNVEVHPTWSFASTGVRNGGDGAIITGDLTLNGVTRSVELDAEFNGAATDPFGNARAGFSGTTEISRKDYDLTWNVALEAGGVMVSDKVKIELEVSAIKQA